MKPEKDASYIFRFIGDVWSHLPYEDRQILANFWQGLVQSTGSLKIRAYELNMSYALLDIPAYSDERWCSFTLDDTTRLSPSPYSGYNYAYLLGDSRIVSIPKLQERIDRADHILVQGSDYIVADNVVAFVESPETLFEFADKHVLWAPDTFIDKELPYRNFGVLINLYRRNTAAYLNIIRGLWYAYWTGPRVKNIITSLNLLFDLPTVQEDGVVTEIKTVLGVKYIVVTSLQTGAPTEYTVPQGLAPTVAVGDEVKRFDPLVSGIRVLDKMNTPDFIGVEIGRQGIQTFLTQYATRGYGDTDETKALELLKEHLWIPQIDSDVFNYAVNVSDIKNFLSDIKPSYTEFIFQMFRVLEDYFSFTDSITQKYVDIDITTNVDNSPVNYLEEGDFYNYANNGDSNMDLDLGSLLLTDSTHLIVYDSGHNIVDEFDA